MCWLHCCIEELAQAANQLIVPIVSRVLGLADPHSTALKTRNRGQYAIAKIWWRAYLKPSSIAPLIDCR